MYQGLKKVGCKVIWGLKGFENPAKDDENFRVMEWLPQIEILAHPGLKAGLTHCGFGGVLEFISMKTPCVVWPHMVDQHGNGDLLVSAGAGVTLCNKVRYSAEWEE
jgi:glucuronosyltransferase